jgi:hypothetical protein
VASAVPNSHCLRYTGSHIPPAAGQCEPDAGRVYTLQDIEQTGATSVGGGLHRLIP